MGLLKENKAAIRFLLVFVGLYITLNTIYGFFAEAYLPNADPITVTVTRQVSALLSIFDPSIQSIALEGSKNIGIYNGDGLVLNVFEGCNGVNVMIVFLSFIVAFSGPLKLTVWFASIGILAIYVMNLGRVSLLYGVEIYFPQYIYFFHKYLFTGLIYLVVFLIWYLWTKRVKRAPR